MASHGRSTSRSRSRPSLPGVAAGDGAHKNANLVRLYIGVLPGEIDYRAGQDGADERRHAGAWQWLVWVKRYSEALDRLTGLPDMPGSPPDPPR